MFDEFDRFTERSQKVLTLSSDEAEKRSSRQITTAHLVGGILREKDNVAARVLMKFGIDTASIAPALSSVTGNEEVSSDDDILTKEAKQAIGLSTEYRKHFGHSYLGPEHLLLGILGMEDCDGVQLITSLGVSLTSIREEIEIILSESSVLFRTLSDRTQTT